MMSCVLCFPWVVIRVRILFGRPFHELSLISQVVGESSQNFVFIVPSPLPTTRPQYVCGHSTHPLASAVGLAQEPPVRRGMKLPLPRVELQVRLLVVERPYIVNIVFAGAGSGWVI